MYKVRYTQGKRTMTSRKSYRTKATAQRAISQAKRLATTARKTSRTHYGAMRNFRIVKK